MKRDSIDRALLATGLVAWVAVVASSAVAPEADRGSVVPLLISAAAFLVATRPSLALRIRQSAWVAQLIVTVAFWGLAPEAGRRAELHAVQIPPQGGLILEQHRIRPGHASHFGCSDGRLRGGQLLLGRITRYEVIAQWGTVLPLIREVFHAGRCSRPGLHFGFSNAFFDEAMAVFV